MVKFVASWIVAMVLHVAWTYTTDPPAWVQLPGFVVMMASVRAMLW